MALKSSFVGVPALYPMELFFAISAGVLWLMRIASKVQMLLLLCAGAITAVMGSELASKYERQAVRGLSIDCNLGPFSNQFLVKQGLYIVTAFILSDWYFILSCKVCQT